MSKGLQSLLGYSCRNRAIQYPIHLDAIRRIELLHKRARASGHAGGLLITGFTGSGKSTVKREYEARFPQTSERDITRIPVLCVDTPTAPTAKNLAETILIAVGAPMSHRGSAEEKTQRIYHLFKLCGVELLIIDEFQQIFEHCTRNELNRVTDWLKNMLNNAGIPVVLIGLPHSDQVLRLNVQLARRFSSRYCLRPFSLNSEEEIQEFRGMLNAIEKSLPLPSITLSDFEMAQRFYYATYGLIDFIGKIIDGAVLLAYQRGYERLDENVFADAFEEEVWREVPTERNPFLAKPEHLRPLTNAGEPFVLINAPVANRVGRPERLGKPNPKGIA